ncbi:His Kinase A domain containing protein, partial [Modicella reniformis]
MIKSSFKFPASQKVFMASMETRLSFIRLVDYPSIQTVRAPLLRAFQRGNQRTKRTRLPNVNVRFDISWVRTSYSKSLTKKASATEESTLGISTDAQRLLPIEGKEQLGLLKPIPRVLIVEDNIANREIVKTFLKKRGVVVVEAVTKVRVEKFQEEVRRRQGSSGFEFVLMDLQMPVMDENIATKKIREFEHGMVKQHDLFTPETSSESILEDSVASRELAEAGQERVKRGYQPTTIFALTGLAGEEDIQLAFGCGVDGYVTKPVSLTSLGRYFRAAILTTRPPPSSLDIH